MLEGIVPLDFKVEELRGAAVFVEADEIYRYGQYKDTSLL